MKRLPLVVILAAGACGSPQECPRCPEPVAVVPAPGDAGPADAGPEPEPEEPERTLILTAVRYADLPGWKDGEQGGALVALKRSCAKLRRYKRSRSVGRRTDLAGKVRDWREVCARARKLSPEDHATARAYFESNFAPYKAANNDDPIGRFTGYYEETLKGSRRRHGPYQTPLYKRPPDLVMADLRDFIERPVRRRIAGRVDRRGRLKPYETRKQIVRGALKGKGLELVWVKDAISAFFVQVQGSGIVELDTGGTMRIGYAGQNGHIYTAIGREMIKDGILTRETVSMQSIRKWLEENPDKADEMMNRNESYVFFEKLRGHRKGPLGSQGVELTAGRSLAIDRVFIAQSLPIWIDSFAPVPFTDREETWRRLVIAQDTGGAIRGPVRGDIYWGTGDEAADIAGRTKSTGSYYLLIPKSVKVTPGPQPKRGE